MKRSFHCYCPIELWWSSCLLVKYSIGSFNKRNKNFHLLNFYSWIYSNLFATNHFLTLNRKVLIITNDTARYSNKIWHIGATFIQLYVKIRKNLVQRTQNWLDFVSQRYGYDNCDAQNAGEFVLDFFFNKMNIRPHCIRRKKIFAFTGTIDAFSLLKIWICIRVQKIEREIERLRSYFVWASILRIKLT